MFVVPGSLETLHRSQAGGYRCHRSSCILNLYSVLFWSLPEVNKPLDSISTCNKARDRTLTDQVTHRSRLPCSGQWCLGSNSPLNRFSGKNGNLGIPVRITDEKTTTFPQNIRAAFSVEQKKALRFGTIPEPRVRDRSHMLPESEYDWLTR